jgi:hypothetical protein
MHCLECYGCDYECLLGAYGVEVDGFSLIFSLIILQGYGKQAMCSHEREHVWQGQTAPDLEGKGLSLKAYDS